MGNGDKAHIEGARTYLLPLPNNCTFEHFDCLYVPTMRRNLLSVVPLEKLGFSLFFFGNGKFVIYKDNEVLLRGFRNSNMYQV